MRYFLNKDTNPKLILKANDTDLQDRWVLHNAGYFMKNEVGNSTTAFTKSKPGDVKLQKTSLTLCEDDFMLRTVLAKTVTYDERDLDSAEAIRMRRRALAAQVDILNNVASNMLPEPLDFFFVTNSFDDFSGEEAKQLKDSEPVLILDYIPGDILADKLSNNWDKSFYRTEDGKQFVKSPVSINVGIVMRLIGDILAFEMELYEKGYAYTALSPDHIILLGDNKPRFVGLGRICPVECDRYDVNHINFGRQLKGYSAPELNQRETNFGMQESVKAAIAFNLGVLIANIILGKTDFDEKQLKSGAYDYVNANEDREAIRNAWHGRMIDTLICKLTDENPSRRLTDFSAILQELVMIAGDAVNEKKKETIYYGNVKFLAHDKGFGFVTSGGVDYFVPLSRLENVPSGYDGQPVAFTIEKDRNGKDVVKAFVTPSRTDVVFPKMVRKPKPIVQPVRPNPVPAPSPQPQPVPAPQPQPAPAPQPQPAPVPQPQPAPAPQPQPAPAPQPQPQPNPQPVPRPQPNEPEKKGFLEWLFGL